jgi:hypothetical protein
MTEKKDTEKRLLQLRTILTQTFKTANGVRCLKLIKELSGYDKPNVIKGSDGDLALHAMVYNEGRRDVYLELRKFLSDDILNKVEILEEGRGIINKNK